jgi:hypothetical protein
MLEGRGNVIVEISSLAHTSACILQMDEMAFVTHYRFQGSSKSRKRCLANGNVTSLKAKTCKQNP